MSVLLQQTELQLYIYLGFKIKIRRLKCVSSNVIYIYIFIFQLLWFQSILNQCVKQFKNSNSSNFCILNVIFQCLFGCTTLSLLLFKFSVLFYFSNSTYHYPTHFSSSASQIPKILLFPTLSSLFQFPQFFFSFSIIEDIQYYVSFMYTTQ